MTDTTTAASEPSQAVGAPVERPVRLDPERDEVLRQLDDRTNQFWAGKRARWAALVRAQDLEIERLRAALANESRRVCDTENDCVLQPHCSHAQKCMRPEWDAKA